MYDVMMFRVQLVQKVVESVEGSRNRKARLDAAKVVVLGMSAALPRRVTVPPLAGRDEYNESISNPDDPGVTTFTLPDLEEPSWAAQYFPLSSLVQTAFLSPPRV